MNERTIISIMPAQDWHVLWRDERDPEDWGVTPLIGWALVTGPLAEYPGKQGRYIIGLIALECVDFADSIAPDIEYVHTSDLAEARKRTETRIERERGRAA